MATPNRKPHSASERVGTGADVGLARARSFGSYSKQATTQHPPQRSPDGLTLELDRLGRRESNFRVNLDTAASRGLICGGLTMTWADSRHSNGSWRGTLGR